MYQLEGEKCKLLLAKLIIDNSNVLLLDEPTRNLSPLSNPVIREMLINFDGCIIAISHDRKFIEEVATKIYQINNQCLKLLM